MGFTTFYPSLYLSKAKEKLDCAWLKEQDKLKTKVVINKTGRLARLAANKIARFFTDMTFTLDGNDAI